MNDLYFKVGADYSEVQRLRQEVTLLENKIRTFRPGQAGPSLAQLQTQLTDTSRRMRILTDSAARAGADIQQSIQKGVNGAIGAIYKLRDSLANPITATLSIAGLGALGGFLSQVTRMRAQFQDMRTSIDVVLGSEARGEKLMGQLTEFAKVSPLDFKGVVGAAKQMLGFNIEAQKVPQFLRAIGDVSMGDSARFRQLTLAFSQMSAAGKLMGQDLMQMVNAGFQPLQVMAEKTGKSIGQLKEEMSKGKISSEMVQQAFIDATSEGGKYYQMSEKASKTINGQLSMLGDAFDLMYNDMGQKAEGTIIKVIEGATMLVENYEKFLPTLGAIIATFGVYKASAMAAAYAEKVSVEEKDAAVKKGFEDELKGLNEILEKRRQLAAEREAERSIKFDDPFDEKEQSNSVVKGARYDREKSMEVVTRLSNGNVGRSSAIQSSLDRQIENEREKLKKSLSGIDEEIRSNNEKLDISLQQLTDDIKEGKKKLKRELSGLNSQIDAQRHALNLNAESQDKLLASGGDVSQLKQEESAMRSTLEHLKRQKQEKEREFKQIETYNANDKKDFIIANDADNAKLEQKKQDLKRTSAEYIEQLKQQKKEMSDLIALDEAMGASPGSKQYMKGQLEYMEKMYDQMSPEQQMSEFGQQMREQMEGLRAELSGVLNLDSDISNSVLEGLISEDDAQVLQKARNDIDDYVASLEKEKELVEFAMQETSDATAKETLSVKLNTIEKELNEVQTQRDAIAANQESAARLRGAGVTNADTAAKTKNSVATTLMTAKTKLAAAGQHLLNSALNAGKNAVNGLKAAWLSNPFGLILTGITAIVSALMAFKKTSDDINEKANENTKVTLETTNKVEGLYATLMVANKNSMIYKNSLSELVKMAKDYGITIKDETKAYDELIKKKERLLQLIIEEGKQRMHQTNIDNITQQIAKAQEDYKKKLEKQFDSPNGDVYSSLVVENAMQNLKRLAEIQERIKTINDTVINPTGATIEEAAANRRRLVKEREEELKALAKEREALLIGNIPETAKAMGDTVNESVIRKTIGSMMSFIKKVGESSNKLEVYVKKINDAKDAHDNLADAVEKKSLKELDVTQLTKEAKELALAMDELNDKSKKTDTTIDTANAEKTMAAIKEVNKAVKEAQKETEELANKTTDVQNKSDNLSNTTVAVKTDNTQLNSTKDLTEIINRDIGDLGNEHDVSVDDNEVKDAQAETDTLKEKMDEVDQSIASPTINTSSIMNAISQLQLVQTIITQINGQKMTGYSTQEELDRMKELKAKIDKKENTEAERKEYDKLVKLGQSRSKYNGLDLSPEQAQGMNYFRYYDAVYTDGKINIEKTRANLKPFQTIDNNGKVTIDESKMDAETKAIYRGILDAAKADNQHKKTKDTKEGWSNYQTEIAGRIAKATTKNELDAIKKELSPWLGDLNMDGAQYKWVEQQLNAISDRTKKSNDDPRQRAYEQKKAKSEEDKKKQREKEDAEFNARELEISKKIDSSEKELASIKLNAEKQRVQLERQLEDKVQKLKEFDRSQWLKNFPSEAKKKNYMWEQSISDEEYTRQAKERLGYDTQAAKITFEEMTSTEKIIKADREAMNQYLMEYGTFEEQRAAMAEYYEEKISKAKNEAERLTLEKEYQQKTIKTDRESYVQLLKEYGDYNQKKLAIAMDYQEKMRNASPIEKANLELSKKKEEESLDRDYGTKWKDAGINTQMFEYLDNLNLDVLDELRKKLTLLIQDSSVSVEDLNEASARLSEVENAISSRKSQWKNLNPFRNPNADQKESLERNAQNKRALADVLQKKANQKTEELDKTIEELISVLKGKGVSMTKEDIKNGKANNPELLSLFEGEGKKAFSNLVSKANTQSAEAAQSSADAAEAAQGAEAAEGAAGGGGASAFAITDTIIHGVNQNLQSMPELLEKWGLDDTEFGRGMKDFAESSQYATAAFDAFKSGDFVGVISNLHSAFGSLGDVLGRLGIGGMGSSDKNLEKDIERLTSVNIELTRAVSNLADRMNDSAIKDLPAIYEEQKQYLEDLMKNTQETMQRSAAVYSNGFLGIGGHKSSNHKINKEMSGADWNRISQVVGFSVRSASDFFALSSKNMAKIATSAPDLYAKIKNLADDGYKDASQYMDEYIEMYKELEELENAYRQHLTTISFDDVKSEFSSLLADMSSDTADFAKNFESMMQKAVINGLMKDKYEQMLENWYKNFADFMGNDIGTENEGKLTVQEQTRLKAEYDEIVRQATQERDEIMKMMGWDSQYSQSSGAKAYATMSQDTAEELNGRMTAIAVTTESIREQNVEQGFTLATICDKFLEMMSGNDSVLEQVSSVAATLAKTSLDIAEIRDNTFVIIKPIKEMNSNLKDIKENIKSI